MTTNFEKFVEFNGVLQEWKRFRDEKDAEQVKSLICHQFINNNNNNNNQEKYNGKEAQNLKNYVCWHKWLKPQKFPAA